MANTTPQPLAAMLARIPQAGQESANQAEEFMIAAPRREDPIQYQSSNLLANAFAGLSQLGTNVANRKSDDAAHFQKQTEAYNAQAKNMLSQGYENSIDDLAYNPNISDDDLRKQLYQAHRYYDQEGDVNARLQNVMDFRKGASALAVPQQEQQDEAKLGYTRAKEDLQKEQQTIWAKAELSAGLNPGMSELINNKVVEGTDEWREAIEKYNETTGFNMNTVLDALKEVGIKNPNIAQLDYMFNRTLEDKSVLWFDRKGINKEALAKEAKHLADTTQNTKDTMLKHKESFAKLGRQFEDQGLALDKQYKDFTTNQSRNALFNTLTQDQQRELLNAPGFSNKDFLDQFRNNGKGKGNNTGKDPDKNTLLDEEGDTVKGESLSLWDKAIKGLTDRRDEISKKRLIGYPTQSTYTPQASLSEFWGALQGKPTAWDKLQELNTQEGLGWTKESMAESVHYNNKFGTNYTPDDLKLLRGGYMTSDSELSPLTEAIGARESNNNYSEVNKLGYLGRFQFGDSALTDLGYKENGKWTGKDGINSKEDFLASHAVQDKAIKAYLPIQEKYLKEKGALKYIGKDFQGVKVTKEGLLAAAHLVGAGAVAKMLRTGKVPKDANGTKALEYLKLGGSVTDDKTAKLSPLAQSIQSRIV